MYIRMKSLQSVPLPTDLNNPYKSSDPQIINETDNWLEQMKTTQILNNIFNFNFNKSYKLFIIHNISQHVYIMLFYYLTLY